MKGSRNVAPPLCVMGRVRQGAARSDWRVGAHTPGVRRGARTPGGCVGAHVTVLVILCTSHAGQHGLWRHDATLTTRSTSGRRAGHHHQ